MLVEAVEYQDQSVHAEDSGHETNDPACLRYSATRQ